MPPCMPAWRALPPSWRAPTKAALFAAVRDAPGRPAAAVVAEWFAAGAGRAGPRQTGGAAPAPAAAKDPTPC